jgi:hypothetical protein
MIRTDAPKVLGGKLCRNCARTTPLFPIRESASKFRRKYQPTYRAAA